MRLIIGIAFLLIGCSSHQRTVYLNLDLEDSETGMPLPGVAINITVKSPGFPMDKIFPVGDFFSDDKGEFEYEFQTSTKQICLLFHKDIEGSDFFYDLDWEKNPVECLEVKNENERFQLKFFLKRHKRLEPEP